MEPHFNSYSNSGITCIKGSTHRFYNSTIKEADNTIDLQTLQFLHLLPHLQWNDVSTGMESRESDLQLLARAIMNRTGRNPPSSPHHSTTQRLLHLAENPLQQERGQFGITAATVINILCRTDPQGTREENRLKTPPSIDYLGYPIGKRYRPEHHDIDTWGHSNRSETGWGNWFGIIAGVCKAWNATAQQRRSNPSHITIHDWHSVIENWEIYGGRILREISTSYASYSKLHSIYAGYGAIQNKSQAHELINLLCDLVPTLKKLHMPGTTTEIGLRTAKTLAMRGLGLQDSIQLVSWLHRLPTTRAKDFLALIRDSPRMTVIHILGGCEQIELLILATQGHLSGRQQQRPRGDPTGKKLLPFILVFEPQLFPPLTYVKDLGTNTYGLPEETLEDQKRFRVLLYHSLPDNGNQNCPQKILPPRTQKNNHLRPIPETWRGISANQTR